MFANPLFYWQTLRIIFPPALSRLEKRGGLLQYAPVTFADTLVPCVHVPQALGDSLAAPGFGLAIGTDGSSRCRRAFPTSYDAPPTRGSGLATVYDDP